MDPYSVLRIKPGSSHAEVKRQYRRLAKIYHPDRNPGEEEWCSEQMKQIGEAFSLLSDPAKKQEIDARLRRGSDAVSKPAYRPYERPVWDSAVASPPRSAAPPRNPGPSPLVLALTALASVLSALAFVVVTHQTAAIRPVSTSASVSIPGAIETAPIHPAHRYHSASASSTSAPRRHYAKRGLTSREKDAIALQTALDAEARGRAVEARRLRARGINPSGLNLSQMRAVDGATPGG